MTAMIEWVSLGRLGYSQALALQNQTQDLLRQGLRRDALLLVEHPPVLTLGRGAKREHVLLSSAAMEEQGVELFETERGGDVTYHGPGQLVGYPILFLPPGRQDVRKYVRALEEVLIRTLAEWKIEGVRIDSWPGVWVATSRLGGPKKIAALGVHLSRWYTKHGFALNVHTNLRHYEWIVPCGIREAGVTSMCAELGVEVSLDEVLPRVVHHFGAVFECEMEPMAQPV